MLCFRSLKMERKAKINGFQFINSAWYMPVSENPEIPNWVCNNLILEQRLRDCSTESVLHWISDSLSHFICMNLHCFFMIVRTRTYKFCLALFWHDLWENSHSLSTSWSPYPKMQCQLSHSKNQWKYLYFYSSLHLSVPWSVFFFFPFSPVVGEWQHVREVWLVQLYFCLWAKLENKKIIE